MQYINQSANKTDISTLMFFNDPGHGWCRVPMSLLFELGLEAKISSYSYGDGVWAYLEEDLDFSVFCQAVRETDLNASIAEKHTNGDSFVRNLDTVTNALRRFNPDAESEFMVKVLGSGIRSSDGAAVDVEFSDTIMSTPRRVRQSVSDYLKNDFHGLVLKNGVNLKEAAVEEQVYLVHPDKTLTNFPILLTVIDY